MIDVSELCSALAHLRGDAIVIACQTTRGCWHLASRNPELDVLFRGAMGKGSSLGLGLALARPERKVIVLDGDGSLLMNLGTLATIVDCRPANLILLLCENGQYAGTGGQAIPGAGTVSFAGLARGAGFPVVESFRELAPLREALPSLLRASGPVFAALATSPVVGGDKVKDGLPTMPDTLARLREHLSLADGARRFRPDGHHTRA
jgi:sulfopyruvate decarboxylase subunit beta